MSSKHFENRKFQIKKWNSISQKTS
jgi:hypothetical protein